MRSILKEKRIRFVMFGAGILALFLYLYLFNKIVTVKIGNSKFHVQIANTARAQYQGLGGQDRLKENEGMLFIHSKPQRYGYCMRGMRFDLDFVFIRNGKIADLKENISFNGLGNIIPDTEYDTVLEVNSGTIEKQRWKIGENVRINNYFTF